MSRRLLVAGIIAIVIAVGAYLATRRDSRTPTASSSEEKQSPPEDDNALAIERAREQLMQARDAAEAQQHELAKAKRDAMREAIYRAWGMKAPDEHTSPSTWPAAPPTATQEPFGKDYVRARIREDYIPLAKDCYRQGLKKNPKLTGKLVVKLRIVGTKNTGGLVDWVDMASEENTLDDDDVNECLKQSMYTVTFDAPPQDGVITVTVPITLSPDGPRDD